MSPYRRAVMLLDLNCPRGSGPPHACCGTRGILQAAGPHGRRQRSLAWFAGWLAVVAISGCGTTKSYEATQQLLLSEAVDQSISAIDFRPLTGQKVFLDTQYLKQVKTPTLVNSDYVVSALRQQITGAGCLLQAQEAEADIIIEARLGALGTDGFQINYGVPSNSIVSNAASLIPGAPQVPSMPELSLARRETSEGAAKVAAFAYDRVTREALWQSGTARSNTTARDVWILGVGPLQTGTVRNKTRWVGSGLQFGSDGDSTSSPPQEYQRPAVDYNASVRFDDGKPILGQQSAAPATQATPAAQIAEQPAGDAPPAEKQR